MSEMVFIARDELHALRERLAQLEQSGHEGDFNRALLESMADGVVACDAEGILTVFNRAAREWHGADARRVPNTEWPSQYNLYQPDGVTPLPPDEVPLARAFRGQKVVDAGMAIAAPGRPVRLVVANGGPISDAAGTRIGAVVVMRDVTTLRRVEADLRRANEELGARVAQRTAEIRLQHAMLRGILESSPSPIFSVDREYRYTSFNEPHGRTMESLYGVKIGVGRSLLEFMTVPEDREAARRNLDRALAGETVVEEAFSGKDDRARRYFRVVHSPIPSAEGDVIGVSVFAHDLTERKRAEDALQESEERYRLVFDRVTDALFLLDVLPGGRYRTLEVNPALERLTGVPSARSLGKTPEESVDAETAAIANAQFRRCVDAQRSVEEEVVLELPAGRRHLHTTLIPVRGPDETIRRIVGVSRDVTEQRRSDAMNAARLHLMRFAALHSLDELLEESLNEAERLSGSLIGFFHFVDDDQGSVSLQNWSTRTKALFCKAEGKGRHYPVAEAGVWADSLRERRPAIHNDVAALPNRKGMPSGHADVTRELVVPVIRGDRVVAILGVGNKPTDYLAGDLEDLSLLADLAWEVADRKRAEEALRRLNRQLLAISECNQTLMRAIGEQELLDAICRIVCERAGYQMACVAFAEQDEAQSIRLAAWAGADEGYATQARPSWGEGERGRGPAGVALRSGRTVAVQDLALCPEYLPWLEEASGRGFQSAIWLPLRDEQGATFGLLQIYSAELDSFSRDEIGLLEELAGDLAFGICVIRARARHREAEEQLRTSDRRYRMAETIGHVGNWEYDVQKGGFWGSDEAKRIYGFDPSQETFSTEEVERCISERQRVHQALIDLIEKGVPYDLEFEIHPVDGSAPRRIASVAQLQRDEHGAPGVVTGVIQDITVRWGAEAELRRSEDRYRTLLQKIQAAVVVHGADGRIVMCNARAQELLGRTEDQIQGMSGDDASWRFLREDGTLMPSEEYPVSRVLSTGAALRNVVMGTERPAPGQQGAIGWALVDAAPVFGESGEIAQVVVTFVDISERKAMESSLRASEQNLALHVEQTPLGVIEWDLDFRVTKWNPAAERIFGYGRGEALGRHGSFVLPSGMEPKVSDVWKALLRREGGRRSSGEAVTKDGKRIHCDWYNTPLVDDRGRVIAVASLVQDVTDRRRLEAQLRHAQKMEAIGTLAGGVAHDFNNVLTVIIGYGRLLAKEMTQDEPKWQFLREILAAASRATQVTRGLLTFSRKQVLEPQPIDLNEVVRNVEKFLRRLIGEDVELSTAFEAERLVVMADGGQIEQVLMNLATNARDAMPEGGLLSIATAVVSVDEEYSRARGLELPGKYAQIAVSDSGVGMDDSTREKLFEPFFTTKEVGKGTGLGLAIVYGIVKQHAGAIEVYSELGHGTTFKILIPLAGADPDRQTEPTSSPPPRGTETILLAEDDPAVRGLIGRVLGAHGYRVIEAEDGVAALEQFSEHRSEIAMLLLDVIMPRMSGRGVHDAVKVECPDVPTLFLSGYTGDVIHKKGMFDDGVEFLSKPINPFDLLTRVREVIDKARHAPARR